jgi:hypothetical protein
VLSKTQDELSLAKPMNWTLTDYYLRSFSCFFAFMFGWSGLLLLVATDVLYAIAMDGESRQLRHFRGFFADD